MRQKCVDQNGGRKNGKGITDARDFKKRIYSNSELLPFKEARGEILPNQLRFPDWVTKKMMPLRKTGMLEKELIFRGNDDCDVRHAEWEVVRAPRGTW